MATIRVECGCGITYRDAAGTERHALKTPEDGSFECDDAQAARLVNLRVAEYVQPVEVESVEDCEEKDEAAPDPQAYGSQKPEKKMGHLSAEDLETWEYSELKKLATNMGIVPNGKKKADYIAALAGVEVELGHEVDPEDLDDLPNLSTAEPE